MLVRCFCMLRAEWRQQWCQSASPSASILGVRARPLRTAFSYTPSRRANKEGRRESKDEQRTPGTSKPSFLAEEPRLPLPFWARPSGSTARTRVGPAAGLSTKSCPSSAVSRSARRARPVPVSGLAPPLPSPTTSTTSPSFGTRHTLTRASEAPECLATLVRASATTKYAVASTAA
jgi:hypothetical protein